MVVSYIVNTNNIDNIDNIDNISNKGYKLLTQREKEVYLLKQKGMLQLDIAKKLNISQPAVSGFYNNAIKKISEAKEIIAFVKGGNNK